MLAVFEAGQRREKWQHAQPRASSNESLVADPDYLHLLIEITKAVFATLPEQLGASHTKTAMSAWMQLWNNRDQRTGKRDFNSISARMAASINASSSWKQDSKTIFGNETLYESLGRNMKPVFSEWRMQGAQKHDLRHEIMKSISKDTIGLVLSTHAAFANLLYGLLRYT